MTNNIQCNVLSNTKELNGFNYWVNKLLKYKSPWNGSIWGGSHFNLYNCIRSILFMEQRTVKWVKLFPHQSAGNVTVRTANRIQTGATKLQNEARKNFYFHETDVSI